jgi:hypothetical protein
MGLKFYFRWLNNLSLSLVGSSGTAGGASKSTEGAPIACDHRVSCLKRSIKGLTFLKAKGILISAGITALALSEHLNLFCLLFFFFWPQIFQFVVKCWVLHRHAVHSTLTAPARSVSFIDEFACFI